MALSRLDIESLAVKTTGQRLNSLWLQMRKGRLTASNFGHVLQASRSGNANTIESIRNDFFVSKDISNCPPVKWGVDHEKQAIDTYQKLTGFQVAETGLWLFPDGYIGASPDGLVYIQGQLTGILEVKCPWRLRSLQANSLEQLVKELPFLSWPLALNHNHDYYHQVQGELFATGAPWCDFVVWSPLNPPIVLRVTPDASWYKTTFAHIKRFYLTRILRPQDLPLIQDAKPHIPSESLELPTDLSHRSLSMIQSPQAQTDFSLQTAIISTFASHLSRRIHLMSDASQDWPLTVAKHWSGSLPLICYSCLKEQFCSLHPMLATARHLITKEVLSSPVLQSLIYHSLLTKAPESLAPCNCMTQ